MQPAAGAAGRQRSTNGPDRARQLLLARPEPSQPAAGEAEAPLSPACSSAALCQAAPAAAADPRHPRPADVKERKGASGITSTRGEGGSDSPRGGAVSMLLGNSRE